MQFNDIMRAVLAIFPAAELGEDMDGQLVIYTGLEGSGSGDEWHPIESPEPRNPQPGIQLDTSKELYGKILVHSNCVIELDHDGRNPEYGSAIEIASYADGENLAIECTKCNVVIMDVDRPEIPESEPAPACAGCGRPELDCSANPCESVIRDRESEPAPDTCDWCGEDGGHRPLCPLYRDPESDSGKEGR